MAKLLAYFLENPGRVISRDELIESVWAGRVVTDDAVHRCVSILRQTLSPDDTQAYIETITRRGYVAHFPPPDEPEPAPAPSGLRSRKWLWAIPAVVLLAGVSAWLVGLVEQAEPTDSPIVPTQESESPPLVAVLPFDTFGDSVDGPFFANGVHDDLLTQLAQIQGLRVISRTSVLEYQDSGKSLRQIGDELGADAILEGHVQTLGDQIRINVQLIDAASDEHLWAETYDRVLSTESLFAVQSEIARAVANALHATLTEQDVAELAILPTDNMVAYRAYHEAMDLRDDARINDPAYVASLERAVALDPEFVRAWVELGGYLSFQYFSFGGEDRLERAEQIVQRVRKLSPQSADHLIAQAYYTYYVLQEYPRAYRLISEAQRMRPSDARLLDLKSWIQRRLGDFDGTIESVRLASTLDPRNARWKITLIARLAMAHRYDEAEAALEATDLTHPELMALQSLLDVREHGSFARWADERAELQRQFPDTLDPLNWLSLWDALVAARRFDEAEALIFEWSGTSEWIGDGSSGSLTNNDVLTMLTHWLLQRDDLVATSVFRARGQLEAPPDDDQRTDSDRALLDGLMAAVTGDVAATRESISLWRQGAPSDLAELYTKIHLACRALGVAGLADETVECLREALREPSLALHFIEPEMPFYDAVRDDPGFVHLVEALPMPSQSRESTH